MGRWEHAFQGLMTTALDRRVNLDDAVKQGQRAWRGGVRKAGWQGGWTEWAHPRGFHGRWIPKNDELESFRRDSIREIERAAPELREEASRILGQPVHDVRPVGSVVDPPRFTEESDVDGGFLIADPSLPEGVNEHLSEKLQHGLKFGFGFGTLNTLVFNDTKVEKGAIRDAIRGMVDKVTTWLRTRVAEDQFLTGAQAMYVGLALDTGEDAGQYALDELGINRTFSWASQRDFQRDRFAVRGSKIIQHAYGEHLDQLARIVIEATDPARPLGHDAVRREIEAAWSDLTRAEAVRIARTETANVWERTNWYALRANGVRRVKWVIASGPAIGRRVGEVCDVCARKRGSYVISDLLEIPPAHPHCRCTLVADLDATWLPPLNPWTGAEHPLPMAGFDGNDGQVPPNPPVMKARVLAYPSGAVDIKAAVRETTSPADPAQELRDRVAELREQALDESWHDALDAVEDLELSGPQAGALQKTSGRGWDAGLHPRGWHGHWAGTGGPAGGRSEPKGPPKLPFKPPPPPRGRPGERRAGGFGANGMTATRMGDLAEASIRQLGIHSLLIGRRQGPLDAAWDHTYGFEVKSVSVHAREYKAAMKTHEIQEKRAAAEAAGLKGAMMIVVMDTEKGVAHAYWREGIQNGRLNEDWNYAGTVSLDTGQRELAAA